MLKYVLITLLFQSTLGLSRIKVKTSTNDPVKGQPFDIVFNIEQSSDEEPAITFEVYGLDLVEKRKQGTSTKTTYYNGKLSTVKESMYVYEMMPTKAGRVTVRDIQVKVDGRIFRHPSISLLANNTAKNRIPIFVFAVPDKTEVYVGESILLRYYLYFKNSVSNTEIREFPKLQGFMKRFLQEKSYVERVDFKGELYNRTLIYSSIIFPEKKGNLKVDPLGMTVFYPERKADPFSNFGFGLSRMRKKNIDSKVVNIKVLPLPEVGKPEGFKGLVGPHDFSIKINKNRFLVNEPAEVVFKVEGEGNLENFDVGALLESDLFEEFESSSNLETTNGKNATKTFNYTYLAKQGGDSPERVIQMHYFNSATKSYKSYDIVIPAIRVAGKSLTSNSSPTKSKISDQSVDQVSPVSIDRSLLAPVLVRKFKDRSPFYWVNRGLIVIICMIVFFKLYQASLSLQSKARSTQLIQNIKKNGIKYQTVYPLIKLLGEYDQLPPDTTAKDIIKNSNLSVGAKSYFKSLLAGCEQGQYSEIKEQSSLKFIKRYFKELNNYLNESKKDIINENNQIT
jgi:hypothetical protein